MIYVVHKYKHQVLFKKILNIKHKLWHYIFVVFK